MYGSILSITIVLRWRQATMGAQSFIIKGFWGHSQPERKHSLLIETGDSGSVSQCKPQERLVRRTDWNVKIGILQI